MEKITLQETARRKKRLLWAGIAALAAAAGLLAMALNGLRLPCLFYELTGLYCPGCGNTRAVMALWRLDFIAAFRYNPLFLLELGYLAWVPGVCVHRYLQGKRFSYVPLHPAADAAVLASILLWGVFRNLLQLGVPLT